MKLSTNKKKIIVLTSMVVLLVVAGTLNFVLNSKLQNPSDGGDVTTTFFSEHRTSRETSRNEQMTWLDSIINSETSTKEAIASAESEKLTLAKHIEQERVLETLVKSKGFEEAVVTLSKDKLSVIVQKPNMTETDAAVILDIVLNETDYAPTQIEVVPYSAE